MSARVDAEILGKLAAVIEARRDADPTQSYVASLHQRGLDVMLKKLGEEAVETIIAAKNPDRESLITEMADLWFHALVVLSACEVHPDEVLSELSRRFGLSGIAEKADRTTAGKRSD